MNHFKRIFLSLAALCSISMSSSSFAEAPRDNVVGVAGYDLTSYFSQEKPQRGNGHHVAVVDGVTYLFASDANKKTFETSPAKFLPQFGGYCAFGVSVGKKFVADPDQFDIVEDKLYLNLDSKTRAIWTQNVAGRIADGNSNWKKIASKQPSEL